MNTDTLFEWSQQTYSLRHIVHQFRNSLPVLVLVDQGFCGLDDRVDFPANEVYLIVNILAQKRVIAETPQGTSISIPTNHSLRFIPMRSPKSKHPFPKDQVPLPLHEIIRHPHTEFDPLYIQLPKSHEVSFEVGVEKTPLHIEHMEILNCYDEPYLVGLPVVQGHIYEKYTCIPVYVDIVLRVSKSLASGDAGPTFVQTILNLQLEASTARLAQPTENPEIMFYNKNMKKESDYEYFKPNHYVSFFQKLTKARESADEAATNVPLRPPRHQPPSRSLSNQPTRVVPIPAVYETWSPECSPGILEPMPRAVITTDGGVKKPQPLPRQFQRTRSEHRRENASSLNHPPSFAQNSDPPTVVLRLNQDTITTVNGTPPATLPKTARVPPMVASSQEKQKVEEKPSSKPQETLPKSKLEAAESLTSLSKYDIAECLKMLKLEKYVDDFLEEDIDGELLSCLDDPEIFIQKFNFSAFEAKKLQIFITGWRPEQHKTL